MLEQLPKVFGPIKGDIRIVEKIWGEEYILPHTDGYTTKFMKVKPGGRCSIHFHRIKNETFVLVAGELIVAYFTQEGEEVQKLMKNPFDSLILPKCTPHTFFVQSNTSQPAFFIESSTADLPSDSYRLNRSSYDTD